MAIAATWHDGESLIYHNQTSGIDPAWFNGESIVFDTNETISILLTVADLLMSHAVDSVVLSQKHLLSVDDLLHQNSIDAGLLTQKHVLVIADILQSHSIDLTDLFQKHILSPSDLLHSHSIDHAQFVFGIGLFSISFLAKKPVITFESRG